MYIRRVICARTSSKRSEKTKRKRARGCSLTLFSNRRGAIFDSYLRADRFRGAGGGGGGRALQAPTPGIRDQM
eukprot:938241-Prorocentrum_minimum.AAC.1